MFYLFQKVLQTDKDNMQSWVEILSLTEVQLRVTRFPGSQRLTCFQGLALLGKGTPVCFSTLC